MLTVLMKVVVASVADQLAGILTGWVGKSDFNPVCRKLYQLGQPAKNQLPAECTFVSAVLDSNRFKEVGGSKQPRVARKLPANMRGIRSSVTTLQNNSESTGKNGNR